MSASFTVVPTPTFAAGKFGNAIDTTNGYLTYAGASAFATSTGTLEYWAKTSSSATMVVLGRAGADFFGISGGTVFNSVAGGFTSANLADGAWHHYAWTWDGTTFKLYIDGVASGSTSSSFSTATWPASGGGSLVFVGKFSDDNGGASPAYGWAGQIDELRISNNVRYTTGFTPPSSAFTSDANTIALYHLDSDGTDSSSGGSPAVTNTVAPAITGTATTGSTLTCSTGSWSVTPDSYTYQWQRDGSAISGATSSTYVLVTADQGRNTTCVVTAVKATYTSGSATSNTVSDTTGSGGTITNSAAPVASGSGTVGATLSVTNGSWSATPDSYMYQWKRGGSAISGATSATYVLVSADASTTVTCTVTAVKSGYTSGSATSNGITVAAAGTIAPNDSNIVYSPYNWDVNSVRAMTINPGAYFRFGLNGTAATLNFDLSTDITPYPILKYRIDGDGWITATLAATVALTIPTDNSWSKHVIEVVVSATSEFVYRWTPQEGAVILTGITTAGSLFAIQTRPLKVLFYGDSITEGYVSANNVSTPDGSDATVAWPYRVSSELGCEVGIVGFGAQGWASGGQGGVPIFPNAYTYLWSGVSRSFTPNPDVIVVNHGQNGGAVTATVVSWITAMLGLVSSSTKIIILSPFSGVAAANLQSAVTTVNNPQVTYVDTTGWWSSVDSPDSVHPYGYASMAQLGPRTANAIRAVLGTGTTSTTSRRFINIGGNAVPIG